MIVIVMDNFVKALLLLNVGLPLVWSAVISVNFKAFFMMKSDNCCDWIVDLILDQKFRSE